MKSHLKKDEIMTKPGIYTNWMEYVQSMSSISPTIIVPSTFSHKILSERSQKVVGHIKIDNGNIDGI